MQYDILQHDVGGPNLSNLGPKYGLLADLALESQQLRAL